MGGRKVFQPATVLTAADVNEFLMNQSVMVFANSTARSAALTSPTEGMTTYLEDTNKVEVWTGAAWTDINDNTAAIPKSTVTTAGDLIVADGNASVTRLGIGANGQVLSSNGTTATWTTPAGGGDKVWTQLHSGNITTGSNTFTVSSLASYDSYAVIVNSASSTNGADLYLYPNSSTSGNFGSRILGWKQGNNDGYSPYTGALSGEISLGRIGTGSQSVNAYALFSGSKGSSPAQVQFIGGPNDYDISGSYFYHGGGMITKAASISSFTLRVDSGTFDGGNIKIYGA